MTTIAALVAMARPSQVALVVLVGANGALLGLWRGGAVGPATGVGLMLLMATAVCVHWANEAADAGTDAISVRTPFSGGSGALAGSGLDPGVPLSLALRGSVVVASGGLVAVWLDVLPPIAAALLVGGLAGGLAYSLPPIGAMRRGWGELLNALLGGMLLPLFGVAVVRGVVSAADVVAFLPFTLVVFGSVLATAWPDREADAATGKRTLQVRWPPPRLRTLAGFALVGAAGATSVAALTGASPVAWLGLLVLPLQVIGWARYTRGPSPWPSVAAMVGMVAIGIIGLAGAVR